MSKTNQAFSILIESMKLRLHMLVDDSYNSRSTWKRDREERHKFEKETV